MFETKRTKYVTKPIVIVSTLLPNASPSFTHISTINFHVFYHFIQLIKCISEIQFMKSNKAIICITHFYDLFFILQINNIGSRLLILKGHTFHAQNLYLRAYLYCFAINIFNAIFNR